MSRPIVPLLVAAAMLVAACASTADETTSVEPAAPTTELVEETVLVEETETLEETDAVEEADVTEDAEPVEVAAEADAVLPEAIGETGGDPARGAGNPTSSLRDAMTWTAPAVGGGDDIVGSEYLGRDVILWFWAPWCSWCNAEAPRVAQAARDFEGQVEILGLAGVSNMSNMEAFVERHGLEHIDHAADTDGDIWLGFDINYQPWWIFVNDDGTVIENWQGRLSDEEIEERIQQLIEM